MTQEWQEATNQRLKELGIEPISGPASENYQVPLTIIRYLTIQGKGMIYGDYINRKSHAVAHEEKDEE